MSQLVEMNTNDSIPAEWQCWLQVNLSRNVSEQQLLNIMVEKRFNADMVRRCIAQIKSRRGNQIIENRLMPTPLNGDWQQWLDHNIEQGVLGQTLVQATRKAIQAAWEKRIAFLRAQSEASTFSYDDDLVPFRQLVEAGGRTYPILMSQEQPRIALFGNVLSKEECESIIALAKPKMTPSLLLDNANAKPTVMQQRSSNGTYFRPRETPLIERLEQRFAELTGIPLEHGEGIQILHYPEGGEYRPHFDFFPPEHPGSMGPLQRGGQRVATG